MSYSKTQHTDSTGGESRNSHPSIPSQMLSNFKVIEGHYETVWIQIRTDTVRPDLGPNYLQRLSADDKMVIVNLLNKLLHALL